MVRRSLAVFTAAGLHIKLIFSKDLKSVQFHSLKKRRRFKIEVFKSHKYHNLGSIVIGHVKCFGAEITFMQACRNKI